MPALPPRMAGQAGREMPELRRTKLAQETGSMTVRNFILADDLETPIEVSFGMDFNDPEFQRWSEWMFTNDARRIVAQDCVGPFLVSTVFLGVAISLREAASPMLWETMVFENDSPNSVYAYRYGSRSDALSGHATAVDLFRSKLS